MGFLVGLILGILAGMALSGLLSAASTPAPKQGDFYGGD
jgi:hypothetical protein